MKNLVGRSFQIATALMTVIALTACEDTMTPKPPVDNIPGNEGSSGQPTPTPGSTPRPSPAQPSPTPKPEPVEDDYTQYKPTGGESIDEIAEKCELLSKVAAYKGVKTLVIGFEGLISFDSSGTQAAYKFLWDLSHSRKAPAPTYGGGGYLLHGLVVPLIKHYDKKIEVLMFPEYSQSSSAGSAAERCATIWVKSASGRKLVITGHSYGGHAANQLAVQLDQARVPIDFVFTVDARTKNYIGSLGRTQNAARWDNFYQTNTLFLNGYSVPDADSNTNLSSDGVSHTSIPGSPKIFQAVTGRLVP
jgi:hypothetical protein